MRLSFDAEALIYASKPGLAQGEKVAALFKDLALNERRFGSTLLPPELLIKPTRLQREEELGNLYLLLGRLRPVDIDKPIDRLAVGLGARYGLKGSDALHLATAVHAGADAFVTNNRKDFVDEDILELRILYPDDL